MRLCSINGCENKHLSKGYCSLHYYREKRGQDIDGEQKKYHHSSINHSLYSTWESIRQRCNNPNSAVYSYYGGRGIKVCRRWDNFANFIADMGERPTSAYSIDRIDNNGNYEPSNCRWATKSEQALNRNINSSNTSGATGVYFDKQRKKWLAYITISGKRHTAGAFYNFNDALACRQLAKAGVA